MSNQYILQESNIFTPQPMPSSLRRDRFPAYLTKDTRKFSIDETCPLTKQSLPKNYALTTKNY